MVEGTITDGRRIAELLSSEIHGHERGPLGRLTVVDADRDAEPAEFGSFSYGVDVDGERLADVYIHPDRVRVEFRGRVETATREADGAGLRARPKAVDPPRTLVFVESGADVKPALAVFEAAAASVQ